MNEDEREVTHSESPAGTRRMVLTALAFIVCFTLAVFAMRMLTPGASLYVEGDKTATGAIDAGALKLHQEDGNLVQKLIVGHQRVRAGKYRLEADIDGVRLEYSTGQRLEIGKGDEVTLVVRGEVED